MKPLLVLAILAGLTASQLPAAPTVAKPNIILILADDLGYGDIGPFGSTQNRTPQLDRMAREGLRLTSFYGAPVCTPSRAQIMTGCYAKRVSLPNVLFPASTNGLSDREPTVAQLLKAQSYATLAVGKWHLGDHPDFLPTRHGFDQYFGLPYSNDMGGRETASNPGKPRRDRRPPLPLVRDGLVIETVSLPGQDRLTERYTEEAVKFIRAHQTAPFFLYLPHTAVHVPLHPGQKFRGQSTNGTYGDWVEELDWSVGRVLETVRELGMGERTLVLFTSDNGPWLTQGTNGGVAGPLRGGKGGTFEGGVREPTIVWWPGQVAAGASNDAVAANFDLLPTFVKLAGGSLPAQHPIDGKDLSDLFLGRSRQSPHEAHYYFDGNNLQAVRSGPWKLAIARQNENLGAKANSARRTNEAFSPTLFNLDQDLGERTNVAALYPDQVRRLRELATKMDADLGITRRGPGVRPAGHVTKPIGLWLPGQEPTPATLAAFYDVKPIDQLAVGESLDSEDAPQIAERTLTVSVEVEPKTRDGVIVAQGGLSYGFALHLREGCPVFTVRDSSHPVSIAATNAPTGRFRLEARLGVDGALSLRVNDQVVASGKTAGPITRQPAEDFCVGHDNGRTVGDYDGKKLFQGALAHLRVAVSG